MSHVAKNIFSQHNAWKALLMALLALLCFFAFFSNASHMQYSVYSWDINSINQITLSIRQAARFNFWSWPSNWAPGTTRVTTGTMRVGAWRNTGVGAVGDGYRLGNPSTASSTITVMERYADPYSTYKNEYWFWGATEHKLDVQYKSSWNTYGVNQNCGFFGVGNLGTSTMKYSTQAQSFPREFILYGKNIKDSFFVPAVNRNNNNGLLYYQLAQTGGTPSLDTIGQSALASATPGTWQNQLKMTIGNINDRASLSFTPLRVMPRPPCSSNCNTDPASRTYAFNIEIQDRSTGAAAKNAIQLDFLFIALPDCAQTATNCNHFPTMVGALSHPVIATVPYYYTFDARDQDVSGTYYASSIQIQHDNPLPSFMTRTLKHESQTMTASSYRYAQISVIVDADIDDPQSAVFCMKAVDNQGLPSIGTFCPIFTVTRPDFMFISGTLRTFSAGSSAINTIFGSAKVDSALPTDSSRKPKLATPSGSITSANFNNWWDDDAASSVSLHSMTMVSHTSLNTGYDKYDGKSTKRVYTIKRPFDAISAVDPTTTYYTYEVHTKFDLLDTETLRFGMTSGDLWVFMNNVLVLTETFASGDATTVPNTAALDLPANRQALTAASIRALAGMGSPPTSGSAQTFNLDIFMRHNTLADSALYMEFANSTACSAINVLRSSQYASLLDDAIEFDYGGADAWDITKWNINGSPVIANNALRLIQASELTTATVWSQDKLKVLSGFEAAFTFKMSSSAPGFALVIQAQSATQKGSDGPGLGYGGLMNGIALEFDAYSDSAYDLSYNYQHISAHVAGGNDNRLTSAENLSSWPLGSQIVGNLPGDLLFRFTNGTNHNIRVEFSPSDTAYTMYVYVNTVIKPLYTAQFDKVLLDKFFANGAYVGFTTSNYAAAKGQVEISKFKMTVIPPVAALSSVIGAPAMVDAGLYFSSTIQLRDACGAALKIAGEKDKFVAKLIHKSSFFAEPANPDPNVVYDTVTATITEANGMYEISAIPKRAGEYFVAYYMLQSGVYQPIGKSPLAASATSSDKTNNKLWTGLTSARAYSATVSHAEPSPSQSLYMYSPNIVPGLDNSRFPASFDNSGAAGVACIVFNPEAHTVGKGKVLTTAAEYETFVKAVATTNYVACASRVADPAIPIKAGLSAVTNLMSVAWVTRGNTFTIASGFSAYSASTFAILTVKLGSGYVYLEASQPRHTGTANGRAMFLHSPFALEATIATVDNIFYIYAKDRFGNACTINSDPDVTTFSFSPSLTITGVQQLGSNEPFNILVFETGKSGVFVINTAISAVPVSGLDNVARGTLIVNSGNAHYRTSTVSGLVGGTVGTSGFFQVTLYDALSNQVLTQASDKVEITSVEFVSTIDGSIPLTISDPATLFRGWDVNSYMYTINYTPQFSGTYYVKIYINVPSGANKADYEITSSKGRIISIAAGPADTPSQLTETLDGSATESKNDEGQLFPAGTYRAGGVNTFKIISRDEYGYNRYASISATQSYLFRLCSDAAGANPLDAQAFADFIDTTLSDPVTGNGIAFSPQSAGEYIARVVFKKQGSTYACPVLNTASTTVELTAYYTGAQQRTANENKTSFFQRLTKANWPVTITAGPMSKQSIFALLCGSSKCTAPLLKKVDDPVSFFVVPKDAYGNVLSTLTPAQLKAQLSLVYETSTDMYASSSAYTVGSVINVGSETGYTGTFTSSTFGLYTLTVLSLNDNATPQVDVNSKSFIYYAMDTDIPKIGANIEWPFTFSSSAPSNVKFIDVDLYSNKRYVTIDSTTLSESQLPETPFTFYVKTGSTCTKVDAASSVCAPDTSSGYTGRPSYNCAVTVEPAYEAQEVEIIFTSATCALTSGCPSTSCSISKTIIVSETGDTNAYLGAYAVGSTVINQTPLSYGENFALGEFAAGDVATFYVFESSDIDLNTPIKFSETFKRTLTLTAKSAFATPASASAEECIIATYGATVCGGKFEGARVYVFKQTYTLSTKLDSAKFAIAYSAESTVHSYKDPENPEYYTFTVSAGKFSPQRSTLTTTTFNAVAGQQFTPTFSAYDQYGNPIVTDKEFVAFKTSAYYKPSTTPGANPTLIGSASCTFAPGSYPSSTVAIPGIVSCPTPDQKFTTRGTMPFYIVADSVAVITDSTANNFIVNQQLSTVTITSGPMSPAMTQLSLISSTVDFDKRLSPTAAVDFTIYAFIKDKYGNPAEIMTVDDGSFVLKKGDDVFTSNPTITPAKAWTKDESSTTTRTVFYTTTRIAQPTRGGFSLSFANADSQTADYTIYVISGYPAEFTGTDSSTVDDKTVTLYTDAAMTTELKNLAITIDDQFEFWLKVTDTNKVPFLRTLTATTSDDVTALTVSFVAATGNKPLPVVVDPVRVSIANVNYARHGIFKVSVAQSSYSVTGKYTFQIKMNDQIVALYPFIVGAGLPFMDSTDKVDVQTFYTAQQGTVKFRLHDRMGNQLTTEFLTPLATEVHPATQSPQNNKVYVSFHIGQASCADIHDTTNWSGYVLPPITQTSHPNFKYKMSFDPTDNLYTASITPAPRGTYTMNLTYVDASGAVGSYLSCTSLQSFAFLVNVGEPWHETSYYRILAVNQTTKLPIPSATSLTELNAGLEYEVQIYFRDKDGSDLTEVVQSYLFNDKYNIVTMSPLTHLFYDPTLPWTEGVFGSSSWVDPDLSKYNVEITQAGYDSSALTGTGSFTFRFKPLAAGTDFGVNVFMQESSSTAPQITGGGPTSLSVKHGTPATVEITQLAQSSVAGAQIDMLLNAKDKYGNVIDSDQFHSIQVTVSRDASTMEDPLIDITGYNYRVKSEYIQMFANGTTSVKFAPAYEGTYSISIVLASKDGSTFYAESSTEPSAIKIVHETCAGRYLAEHPAETSFDTIPQYRCASNPLECVISYADCTVPADRTACPAGESFDGSQCTSLTSQGYKKCPNGQYVTTSVSCPIVSATCPAGYKQCALDKSQCRSDLADCPSPVAAPPGFVVCPNQLSYAQNLLDCPTIPANVQTSCAAKSGVLCATGACVSSSSECPTAAQCQSGFVYCLTDGQCKPSADQCYTPPASSINTPTSCNAKGGVLCWNGQCASNIDSCPSAMTCPVGYVKCAFDNTCRTSAALCFVPDDQKPTVVTDPITGETTVTPAEPILKPNATSLTCAATDHRCNDGVCVPTSSLCPSVATCSGSTPIQCSDRSCKSSLALCALPDPVISTCSGVICPADGKCVLSADFCTVAKTCSEQNPILCASSYECVADANNCPVATACPPATPVQCGGSSACRTSISDCPSTVQCPSSRPMLCPDNNSCALSIDLCTTSTIDVTTGEVVDTDLCPLSDLKDPSSTRLVKCPSGQCSTSLLTCETTVTCPIGSFRCRDGFCRASCDGVAAVDCSILGLITCPMAGSGVSCATSIANCPQGVTCPLDTPVKCLDASCAASLENCPPLPDTSLIPADKFPCPDGSWTFSTCSPAVVCPSNTPIKCSDQSCKATLAECPKITGCDVQSDSPYLCSSGSCVALPWICSSPSESECADPAKQVKCPLSTLVSSDGKRECVTDISQCAVIDEVSGVNDVEIKTPISQYLEELYENPCTKQGFSYCQRDGTCRQDASACPALTCPIAFPYMCYDGSCAKDISRCPIAATGCPYDRPIRCPGEGSCAKSLRYCPASKCSASEIACSDGTCSSTGTCSNASNGCPTGQVRCADMTCVAETDTVAPTSICSAAIPQSQTSFINACPPGLSYKCPNGLCVEKSSQCPSALAESSKYCTEVTAPIFCASGQCVSSIEQCPIVKPCPSGQIRCGDGSCKGTETECSKYNSCPVGTARCKQSDFPTIQILDGVCAEQGQCFAINGCPIVGGMAQLRCPSGRCVDDLAQCVATSQVCKEKCWNGVCKVDGMECDAINGCPALSPFRCPNGDCVESSTACVSEEQNAECTLVKCASGACVASEEQCTTSFGCPVTAPVRCVDGQCKRFGAEFRSPVFGLTNEEINSLTCSPVVIAPSAQYSLCDDGSVVVDVADCKAVQYKCTTQYPYRCLNGDCVDIAEHCGFKPQIDESGIEIWVPASTKPATCPTSLPILCSTGQCAKQSTDCKYDNDIFKTTITGSSSSSKKDTSSDQSGAVVYQVLCNDGSYRSSYAECIAFAKAVDEKQATSDPEAAITCTSYCSNGQCVMNGKSAAEICLAIEACPVNTYRCQSGKCSVTECPAISEENPEVTCPNGDELCVDGICRLAGTCPHFNGCSMNPNERFHCENRECAAGPALCAVAASRKIDAYALLLLADSEILKEKQGNGDDDNDTPFTLQQEADRWFASQDHEFDLYLSSTPLEEGPSNTLIQHFMTFTQKEMVVAKASSTDSLSASSANTKKLACTSNCVAQQQLSSTAIAYDATQADQEYAVGPLSTGFTVKMFSGLQIDNTKDVALYIHPVAQSQYYNASNSVTYSRRSEFGETLTASQTVLSPVFSCSVGDGIVEPFDASIQLTSLIDRDMNPSPAPRDVCLARLRRYPEHNYMVWECVFTEEQRKLGGQYSTRQDSSQPLRQAVSSITQCYDEELSKKYSYNIDPVSGSETLTPLAADTRIPTNETSGVVVSGDKKVPAIYAFIHSPIATKQVYQQSLDTFLKDNIIWIMFVIIGAVLLLFVLIYAIMRLSRYAKKTEKTKEQIVEMEKEVEDMENYGGDKRHDQEVGYTANPMAISLEQQNQLQKETDPEALARKQKKLEEAQLDSAEREQQILSLEAENQRALTQLEAVRAKAGAMSGAKRT